MEIDSVFLEIGESGRQQVKYVAVLCLLKVRDIWWVVVVVVDIWWVQD